MAMSKVSFTAARVAAFKAPTDREQAFLWDTLALGLGLRVKRGGSPVYVYQAQFDGRTVRLTIGKPAVWTLPEAREKARTFQKEIDEGRDPRNLKAAAKAAREAARVEAAATAEPARVTWDRYLAERQPHWRDRTYTDHVQAADAGGVKRKRGEGVTKPGPLAPLLALPLAELTPAAVDAWAVKEAKDRPARVRLALRMLKAFLRWAAAEPELAGRVDAAAGSSRKAREAAGRARAKDDVLLKEQLPAWFTQVRALPSRTISAYLQCLLLLGCRREELLRLRWEDINWKWRGLQLADKVDEAGREVPLTPYVAVLLAGLPRINEWVFSSSRAVSMDPVHARRRARYHGRQGTEAPAGDLVEASESGRLVEPAIAHRRACAAACIEGLTLHGLRRSFASLTEWLEVPVGVVAQIQGHKPSATAEKHYKRRPLDLLRVHHERIERWMLEQAGVAFDYDAAVETRRPSLAVIGN